MRLVSPKMRGVLPIKGGGSRSTPGDLDGHGAIMAVMHGGGGIPLSAVRPCRMDVTPKKALDMYGNPHLTIPYLLRGEQGDLEGKYQAWIGKTRD